VGEAATAYDAAVCDDSNPCTADSFGADGGCVHAPLTGPSCDDGDACNGTADACVAGVCRGNPGTLREDFSTALDPAKWTTSNAATNSSIAVVGGKATFTDRPFLSTVSEFSPFRAPVRVTAQVTFTSPGVSDFVTLATRSDGTPLASNFYEVTNGVACHVSSAGAVSLDVKQAGVGTVLGNGASPLDMTGNPTIIVELFDDGNHVTCTARTEAGNTRMTATGVSTFVSPKNLVTIYNRENSEGDHVATVDNVTVEAGVTSRPYAQWQFEDANNSTKIVDWAAGYDGTYGSSAGHAAGVLGNNVNVVGNANSYADLGTSLGSLGTSDFTLTWWTKGPAPAGAKDYLGNRDSSSGGQYFGIRAGTDGKFGVEMYGYTAAGGGLSSPAVILDDTWHHVAVERKGATLTIFVDGAQVATGDVTGVPNINSSKTFLFGKSAFNDAFTNYFTGAVDDLRLYNLALPLCEVKNVYGMP
jgi:hypothetical protein